MNPNSLVGHIRELLKAIGATGSPPDRIVSGFFHERRYLGSHDRRTIAEAVFGIIRHRRFLEEQLERFLGEHPAYRSILVPHLRDVPIVIAYFVTADSEGSGSSRLFPGSAWNEAFPGQEPETFTAWLRANLDRRSEFSDPAAALGVRYSFQDWMVRRLSAQFGEETESLLAALNRPAGITLRVNLLNASREECRRRLKAEGVDAEPTLQAPSGLVCRKRFNVRALQSFRDGWYEVQDEGSQMISVFSRPSPGALVIDACAGAGGKSLHCADLMGDSGTIVAFDVEQRRLDELADRARRAGRKIIRTMLPGMPSAGDYVGNADLVLVDAPCSGIGTIRRNPWLKWSVAEADLGRRAAQQSELLHSLARFVRPGGKFVYATCSLMKEENEDVVDAFLSTPRDFSYASMGNHPLKDLGASDEARILLAPHRHGTDGFFMAMLTRGPAAA